MIFISLQQISTLDASSLGEVYVNVEAVSSFSQGRRYYQSGAWFHGTTVCMKSGEVYFVQESPDKIAEMMRAVVE